MEYAPEENRGEADYLVPIEGADYDWPTDDKVYVTEVPKPDPCALMDISIKMHMEGIDPQSELPKELIKYSISLSRPDITDHYKLDKEVLDAYEHIENLISPLSAQQIFDYISQESKANVPTFYTLHEVINDYQLLLVNTDNTEEMNEFDNIRKSSYWMAYYLMTRQTVAKKLHELDSETL